MSAGAWATPWSETEPIRLPTGIVRREDWKSTVGIRSHLVFSDSGLADATEGALGAQYVRFVGGGDPDHGWHCHDLDWQFFYVVRGSMEHETDVGGHVVLREGDAGFYPGFLWHREWGFSPDCELLAFRVPAATTTYTGRAAELPPRSATLPSPRPFGYVYAADPDGWTAVGSGGLEARELGSAVPSDGRIAMHLVRATRDGAGGELVGGQASTWAVVVRGSARGQVTGRPELELGVLDAVTLGSDEGVRLRLGSCSADFALLTLAIPATAGPLAP
jgi:hypothetical protein